MRTIQHFFCFIFSVLFLSVSFGPAWATDTDSLILKTESKLWLEGDSTLHPYRSDASHLKGDILFQIGGMKNGLSPLIQQKKWKQFLLTVPVKKMRSGKKGLDKKMYESLKSDQFPDIVFKVAKVDLQSTKPLKAKVDGSLSLAGATKNITLFATLEQTETGFWIKGEKEILMTDFGITPPKALLGAVKAEDKVTIFYQLLVATP